jgi:broad specificity phosphatase PhoE
MAPNSRIILTRHAQAEHNVDLDYTSEQNERHIFENTQLTQTTVPDAPLTSLGKKQAKAMAPQVAKLQEQADVVVSSPLKRTLQTTKLAWGPAVERLGIENVICLPEAQECNDHPCDTGSAKEVLEKDPELKGFNLENLKPEWTSKQGFWAADYETLQNRAKWVRQWLKNRPEETIVLVAHGDILRRITSTPEGPSMYMWKNAEARIWEFDPKSVDSDDCWLYQRENVAAAGGYGPTSSDADFETN